jgi:hypothetical protein
MEGENPMKRLSLFLMLLALVCYVGCAKDTPAPDGGGEPAEIGADPTTETDPTVDPAPADPGDQASTTTGTPTFTLVTSEYPSWSTFVVAGKAGLVNPARGGDPGPLEEKYGIDVVIESKDYDSCITLYANGTADGSCLTTMDSLNPALGRDTTAIMPTSTSAGADKVIAVGITDIDSLKSEKIYGLKKSVSEYTVIRGLEKSGQNTSEFTFVNLAPDAAATALQTGSNDVKAICVWNPFALQTLKTVNTSTTVFDSSLITGEIIDQVIVGNDVLAKPGGDKFAQCLCEIQYTVNGNLWNSDQTIQDATRNALKADFAPDLELTDMETILKETSFFRTAKDGIALYTSPDFQKTMETVVTTCQKIQVLEDKVPTIGYNDTNAQLNFSSKYMEAVATQ